MFQESETTIKHLNKCVSVCELEETCVSVLLSDFTCCPNASRPCLPQAEFSEINLASYVNSGCMVDMQVNKGGTKVIR